MQLGIVAMAECKASVRCVESRREGGATEVAIACVVSFPPAQSRQNVRMEEASAGGGKELCNDD